MAAPAAAAEPEVPADQAPTTLQGARSRGFYITPTLALRDCACVNDEAIWVLTSARPGNGIPQLLSDSVRGEPSRGSLFFFLPLLFTLPLAPLATPLSQTRSWRSTGSLTAPRRT